MIPGIEIGDAGLAPIGADDEDDDVSLCRGSGLFGGGKIGCDGGSGMKCRDACERDGKAGDGQDEACGAEIERHDAWDRWWVIIAVFCRRRGWP